MKTINHFINIIQYHNFFFIIYKSYIYLSNKLIIQYLFLYLNNELNSISNP